MTMKFTLSSNQAHVLDKFVDTNKLILMNYPTGTGKTFVSPLLVKKAWFIHKKKLKTLFISPPGLLFQVREEFLGKGFLERDIILIRSNQAKSFDFLNTRHPIIIIAETALVYHDRILDFNPELLLVDECHKFKTHSSARTKYLHSFVSRCKSIKYKVIMSGTLLTKNILDIWAQAYILDLGARLGSNYYSFKNKYTYERRDNPHCVHQTKLIYKDDAVSMLIEKLMDMMFTASIEVVLKDVVKPKEYLIKMKLNEEGSELYDRALADIKLELEELVNTRGVKVLGSNKVIDHFATKLATLRQICNGFVYRTPDAEDQTNGEADKRQVYYLKENIKMKYLEKLLHKLVIVEKRKVLVWSIYKANERCVRELCKRMGINTVMYRSSLTQSVRNSMVKRFCSTDPDSPMVFFSHPACGGTGLNLQVSNASIHLSFDYNWGTFKQSLGRNVRKGSEIHDRIDRYYFVVDKTMDEEVYKNIDNKNKFIKSFMNRLINEKEA